MNLSTRVERYRKRGFQKSDAELLVLIEESASTVFRAFPDRFILFGGATLVLFYESPRLSRDIDLLAQREGDLPSAQEIEKAVQSSIQPLAEIFGLGRLEYTHRGAGTQFVRIWVQSNVRTLFTIDLTTIGGTVLKSEIMREPIGGDRQKNVTVPSAKFLLFQKCETFLDRRYIKSRDAFDIDILLAKGVRLDGILEAHLEDFIQMRELDPSAIRARIQQVDQKLCTAELRAILPDRIFTALAQDDFKQLRNALDFVLAKWI